MLKVHAIDYGHNIAYATSITLTSVTGISGNALGAGCAATITPTIGDWDDFDYYFPCTGVYRICATANSACGSSTIFCGNITVVNCAARAADGSSLTEVNAYPNPVKDLLNVSFMSDIQQSYAVKLMDMTGRVVYNADRTAVEGDNKMDINVQGLSSGIYMLNFQMGDSNKQIRVVIE